MAAVDLGKGRTPTDKGDRIRGTPGDDAIDAKGGNDRVAAGGGHDRIIGGAGNDVLDGGPGTDMAYYSGNSSDYRITTGADGAAEVRDLRGRGGKTPDGTDRLVDVERLVFGDGGVQLLSPDQAPEIVLRTMTFDAQDGYLDEYSENGLTVHSHNPDAPQVWVNRFYSDLPDDAQLSLLDSTAPNAIDQNEPYEFHRTGGGPFSLFEMDILYAHLAIYTPDGNGSLPDFGPNTATFTAYDAAGNAVGTQVFEGLQPSGPARHVTFNSDFRNVDRVVWELEPAVHPSDPGLAVASQMVIDNLVFGI